METLKILEIIAMIFGMIGMGGIISGATTRRIAKMEHKAEKREEQRKKTEVIKLKSLYAIGNLSKANTIALKHGKCNGETESALQSYEECKKELDELLINISAEQ